MGCEEIREHLEAYALGALEPDEKARVEEHLAQCVECRALARDLDRAAYAIPQALAAASPMRLDPDVKARLLRSLGVEAEAAAEGMPRSAAGPARAESKTSRLARWVASRWFRPMTIAAAFMLLLAAAVGWGLHLSAAVAKERALRAEFAELVGQQEIVLEVVDSSNTVKRVLRSPTGTPSYGKLYTRTDMAHVVAMAARLPQPPPGEAYHLWLQRGDRIELAGVMNVNDEGFGLLVFDADTIGPTYDSAQLTLQPVGAIAPSDSVIISWREQ